MLMMKYTLFALCSLPTFVFAHSYRTYQSSDQQNAQIQQQEIKGEITPTVGSLPNHDYDIILDAEFLYWYANVTNLDYATKLTSTLSGNATSPTASNIRPTELYFVDTEWDPGCRLGLGVVTNHDGWDLSILHVRAG